MMTAKNNQPVYIFQLTSVVATQWMIFSTFLFLFTLILVGGFYQAIHNQPYAFSVRGNVDEWWEPFLVVFGSFVALPLATFIVHELVHGFTFAAYGGSPRYGVGIKYFLPYFYATSPRKRFSRNAFFTIALAPLIVINLLCLTLLAIFPQATWLGLVVVFNTSGAIGDLWMAAILLRYPTEVMVEDREEGIAIYAPENLDTSKLPHMNEGSRSIIWQWLSTSIFVGILLVFVIPIVLPLLLTLFQVSSLTIGNGNLWIVRWINDASGTSFSLNLLILIPIAGLISLFILTGC